MAASRGEEYLLWETYEVALGNTGEDDHNTLVLSGIDVVIPVELDIDGDPLQDDEVRLRSEDGYYDVTLASSDDDVEVDVETGYLHYRFRLVPPGVYRAAARAGERWTALFRGLVVQRDGAYLRGEKLGEELPSDKPAPAPEGGEGQGDGRVAVECGH